MRPELARRFAEKWETKWGPEQSRGRRTLPPTGIADCDSQPPATPDARWWLVLLPTSNGQCVPGDRARPWRSSTGRRGACSPLAVRTILLGIPTYDEGHEGHEGEQAVAKGLATLRTVDATGVPADDTATHFTLEPSGEADGSHFLVSVSSGRALHLDGLGDKLASVRYGDVRDGYTYSHFRIETVPGDASGAGRLRGQQDDARTPARQRPGRPAGLGHASDRTLARNGRAGWTDGHALFHYCRVSDTRVQREATRRKICA